MTVDVMIPHYGDPRLLELAVRSVLGQHYRDFRLVVVDDGPDDSLREWFAALGDDRVEYLHNERNLGINGNFRRCAELSRHDLVVIMGSDDVMLPNYLDWLVASADRFPTAQLFQPGVVVIDERGAASNTLVERVKSAQRIKGDGPRLLGGEDLAASLLASNWLYFPSIGWRGDALRATSFRPGYNVVLDLWLVLDLVCAGGDLVLDDQLAFMYRRHSGSVSSWRALDGSRFDEERRFFAEAAVQMDALGWRRAARVARRHTTSRLYAATLVPRALKARSTAGLKTLARHVVG